jgi:hypothetical protein
MENEELQKASEKLKQKVAPGAEAVSLDQPFPEELTDKTVPFEPLANLNSQPTAAEDTREPEDSKAEPEVMPSSGEPIVGDIKLTDSIKVPIQPPEAVKTEGFKTTANSNVLFLVAAATVIALAGAIILFTINVLVGLIIILLGVAAILVSLFGPIN